MSVDQRRPGLANAFRNKDYEARMDRHERALATASAGGAGPPASLVPCSASVTPPASGAYVDVPGLSYVAPVAGTYQVKGVFDVTVAAGQSVIGFLKINNVRTGAVLVIQSNITGTSTFRGDFSQQWQITLAAGDTVTFEVGAATTTTNTVWSTHTNLSIFIAGAGPQGPPGPSTPIPRVTTLPTTGLTDGLEVYLAIPAPTLATGSQSAANWHMRYNIAAAKWECIGGPPITFHQEGENAAYQVFAGGSNVTVNAAASKLLAWTFTPPVDVWCEVSSWMAIVNKLDANYHYAQISLNCTPAPPVGSPNGTVLQTPTKMQHASVQTYEPYNWEKIVGLSAGVTYQFYMNFAISGGSWQYHQGSNMLGMNGKAWAR